MFNVYEISVFIVLCVALYHTIYLFKIFSKIYKEATKMLLTPEQIQKELEYSYVNWENIICYEFSDLHAMAYEYLLVIQTSDDRFFRTYVYSDGEEPSSDFEDLEWVEVISKEVVVKAWVEKV